MSRPRFVALLVLTLMWGGVAHAVAQEATPPDTSSEAAADPECAPDTCDELATDEVADEEASDETDAPRDEPVERSDADVAPAAEEPTAAEPKADLPIAIASTANRSATVLADVTVDVIDSDYQPGSVTIQAGDTVTWTQSGEQPHTVTADDGSFDSGEMATDETFSMRFDSPGTYGYYCSLHGGPGGEGMSAVVIVEGSQESEDPPSVDNGDDEGNGDDPAEETAEPSDGSLPRTGGGPPAAWVFALALVVTGYVLARVARLSERVARR